MSHRGTFNKTHLSLLVGAHGVFYFIENITVRESICATAAGTDIAPKKLFHVGYARRDDAQKKVFLKKNNKEPPSRDRYSPDHSHAGPV